MWTLEYPMPTKLSSRPTIAGLRTLIEIKLSSVIRAPTSRMQDFSDVVELMKANQMPRDFELEQPVSSKFAETWDALRAEQAR
jgi:hypothetical protein